MNSQENRELISKYLEGMQELEALSVKSFYEHGKVSGSLLKRLENMLHQKEMMVQERSTNGKREYYCSAISQGFLNKDCLNKQCEACKKSSST